MRKLILSIVLVLLAATAQAAVVRLTFEWDANTESYLGGYALHRGNQTGGPYTEIADVGNVTEYTQEITIAAGEIAYFVLTAYSTTGRESGYSNEVSFFLPTDPNPAPAPPSFRLRRWEVVSYD